MTTEGHPRVGANYFHRAGRSTKRHNLLSTKGAALHKKERKSECNRRQNTKRKKKKKKRGGGVKSRRRCL